MTVAVKFIYCFGTFVCIFILSFWDRLSLTLLSNFRRICRSRKRFGGRLLWLWTSARLEYGNPNLIVNKKKLMKIKRSKNY